MSANGIKLLLSGSALLLFVLLFIAPKTAPLEGKSAVTGKVSADNNASLEVYLNMASKALPTDQKQKYDMFLTAKNFDSITVLWDKQKRPDLAAVFTEESAKKSQRFEDWMKAGNRYYFSAPFIQDKTEVPLLYQCAMRCFSKALKLKPENSDAKIMLASCFVEGTSDPMQGISMLKEVEKRDSGNAKLNLTFAFFSVKSGQTDKAIQRFNKVLAADSNYIEVFLHLADIYEQQGNREKTIEMLKQYSRRTPDPTEKAEVNKYIEQKMKEQ